ncbi:MAG: hypothetical protein F4Y67_02215 [Chloroflexi bacterium]|nr:hypothetical protein [Chloroflexota bacterium]
MTGRFLLGERGSVSVQGILLLGTFMLVLTFVAEFGSLRAKTLRLQSAFDRAALAATGAIDGRALAERGELRLEAAAAEAIAREYLVANLEPFEGSIPGLTASGIATAAQVRISAAPASTVTLSGVVDLPSGLLALVGVGPTVTYRIESESVLKGP